MDTLKSSVTSLSGNNYAQVFTNGKYTATYPMKAKREAGSKLREFINDASTEMAMMDDQTEHTKTIMGLWPGV